MPKKRPELKPEEQAGLFKRTGPAEPELIPQEQEKPDPVKPRGIGLRESEWLQLEMIGKVMGSNAHALAAWAIRDFIRRYEANELPMQERPTLPGL